ncbi:Tox-REase-5 domain-containing protein [Streptomyces sp. NPDC059255]|uniref:Tox-REase-5 domain-containing protein n=1 Tax=Streptomyces sp. NPDC059255 TaxID=3346793 RepID=UPI0036B2B7AC
MSAFGGTPVYGGGGPAPGGDGRPGRRGLPRELAVARALIHVLFGATVLGGLGLYGSALAADAMGAQLLGVLLYGAAPGVVGWVLSRRTWSGGTGVWAGLVAVQVWLILGGLGNVADGSGRGFLQLFLPVLILLFLTRPESRAWFGSAEREREEKPGFSLSHMITWRRDRGQTAMEYAGLITVVAAVVLALALGGVGGQITDGLRSAICSLTGTSCPEGGDGDGHIASGEDRDTAPADDPPAGRPPAPQGDGARGREGSGSGDTYPVNSVEPEAEYDGPGLDTEGTEDTEDTEGSDGTDDPGEGEKAGDTEDCGGWGFFGCAWDRGTQVVKGVFVDGVWGDLTGIFDLVDPETWSGMADYGGQLGDKWTQDSKGATDKWKDGDYLGALGDWGEASVKTVVKVGDDVFVGDEVRDRWNNGEKTRAATDVVWNVGSLFIPGYDVAKVVGKVGKLGKLGKIAEEVAQAATDAGDAARRARKAAEAGDVEGARKAAKEADEAADRAEEQARRTGCTLAAVLRPRYGGGYGSGGTGGVSGSGTGVLAAGTPDRVILADPGCDEAAKAKAEEARKQERAAWLAKKRAEEPERAAKALKEKKPWPEPQRNDTSDPRNYNRPDWAEDLNDPELGSADLGDGYWAGRDRNPPPNWKNESWLRYQEQITGTIRGKEYIVPNPKEGKPAVEYDGWDSGRQTFLEAKNGYDSYLLKNDRGTLSDSGKKKFVDEAAAQVEASGGRAVEWHFSDPDVAKAARKAFREAELPIRVVHTKQRPSDSTRKPEAFD